MRVDKCFKAISSNFLMNPEIYIQLMVHNFNDDSDDSVEFEEFTVRGY